MEGDYKDVNQVFEKVKLDTRHRGMRLIVFSPIQERIFPSWSMGSRCLVDQSVSFGQKMDEKEEEVFQNMLAGNKWHENIISCIIKKFFD